MLFLHGFMGSSGDWEGVAASLRGSFRTLAADLPGHGASVGLPPERYTMEGAAGAVLGLLDGLGVGRCALCGYSMGGRLALYLALRSPGRFSALLLESASPGLEDPAERAARRRADEERARELEGGDLEGFVGRWYRRPLFASLARRGELAGELARRRLRNDPGELARSLRGMGTGRQPPLWGALPALAMPALAVAGELDPKFAALARRMEREAPPLRAAVVPGAGHNVHLERPGAFGRLLREFLEERGLE
ncbi:alpha/beta hydrolase fold [Rubrobacter xylanophilus DSM 9941]|uniref:Putative 2-succinyl-6-hydroxy-2,4-cyclohexadiene-1-carboxylate synthase n=1 Tax=Rubrobacter xylanophilus (strain DSM 9941 / JCM 11954 / NBRC 16129 / PRD-1) TaxID=266117 RepID=Q1AS23_RUBXD|nr:2-succinyl-6-hydroxy-2,4-cyclohexadiene-1-carboxylate synthase [Rubrobacter xylanophilus]ABG05805.1 alpha/beta hydrolase fold [Rubrobacter xylanophilus DSM 9941]